MSIFEKSKWIWIAQGEGEDQYVDFCERVVYDGKQAVMNISCDSDYTLYVNGLFVNSNQYGDYEHYKIYDTLDITDYLKTGENSIRILAYHCGVDNSRYRKAKAGLIYEIVSDNAILACSNEKTLSRLNPNYVSGRCLWVSVQLGFSFEYDATKTSDDGYAESVCVDKDCQFYPRPVNKGVLLDRKAMKQLTRYDGKHYLIDLGEEVVGLPTFELFSKTEQKITFAWGEHIDDGCVRKTIGNRNFYFEYRACIGENKFTEYMLRLGARYLEVFAEDDVEIDYVGIIPQVIEVEEAPCHIDSDEDRRIYDVCVNTLHLCMMEHYVDCPWREQALYAFDSRNQMLSGYYAFKNGNAKYVRANLKLISEDRRNDGLLSICYPCGVELAIPSFSLHYITAMREYIENTGDTSLALEYVDKMRGILDEFKNNIRDGLVYTFEGKQMWNFYDWSDYSSGKLGREEGVHTDLIINCLFVIALDHFEYICKLIGTEFSHVGMADELRSKIRETFYTDKCVFAMNVEHDQYTVLGNSLAILAKVVKGDEAKVLCEKLICGELVESSLSMKIFVYQALMNTDTEKYRDYILTEIRTNYKKMLDTGTTTVWETLDGASAFKNAGSLCHGWSAVPVYIYHRLGIAKL